MERIHYSISLTRVCSTHAAGRRLRPDEVPSVNLPVFTTSDTRWTPRRPLRERICATPHNDEDNRCDDCPSRRDEATQVGHSDANAGVKHSSVTNIQLLNAKIRELEQQEFG